MNANGKRCIVKKEKGISESSNNQLKQRKRVYVFWFHSKFVVRSFFSQCSFSFSLVHLHNVLMKKYTPKQNIIKTWNSLDLWRYTHSHYVAGRLFLVISHQHSFLVHSYFCSMYFSHSLAHTHTHLISRKSYIAFATFFLFLLYHYYVLTNNAIRCMGQINGSRCIETNGLKKNFSKYSKISMICGEVILTTHCRLNCSVAKSVEE